MLVILNTLTHFSLISLVHFNHNETVIYVENIISRIFSLKLGIIIEFPNRRRCDAVLAANIDQVNLRSNVNEPYRELVQLSRQMLEEAKGKGKGKAVSSEEKSGSPKTPTKSKGKRQQHKKKPMGEKASKKKTATQGQAVAGGSGGGTIEDGRFVGDIHLFLTILKLYLI